MSSDASRVGPALPGIDDRLVAPETRYELLEGRLVHVSPADAPHGTRHSKISALVEAHAGLEFEVACDLLTRVSETSEVAPDVSVYPQARDPETGGRQLEQLAFEVVSTQSLSHAGRKAAKLTERGVRRVFAIDLERDRALEWSRELASWAVLDTAGYIEDPALDAPLPIDALLHAAKADDAIASALLIKRNPVIEAARERDRVESRSQGLAEGLAEGKAAGLAEGKATTLLAFLAARGIAVDAAARARVLAERDLATLDRWIARAGSCGTIAELFAEA